MRGNVGGGWCSMNWNNWGDRFDRNDRRQEGRLEGRQDRRPDRRDHDNRNERIQRNDGADRHDRCSNMIYKFIDNQNYQTPSIKEISFKTFAKSDNLKYSVLWYEFIQRVRTWNIKKFKQILLCSSRYI
jgi:hypothetical protein